MRSPSLGVAKQCDSLKAFRVRRYSPPRDGHHYRRLRIGLAGVHRFLEHCGATAARGRAQAGWGSPPRPLPQPLRIGRCRVVARLLLRVWLWRMRVAETPGSNHRKPILVGPILRLHERLLRLTGTELSKDGATDRGAGRMLASIPSSQERFAIRRCDRLGATRKGARPGKDVDWA
jgi:hypothetical protein